MGQVEIHNVNKIGMIINNKSTIFLYKSYTG